MPQAMQIPGLQSHMQGVLKKIKKGKLRGMTVKGQPPLKTSGLKLSLMKSIRGGIDKSGQFKLKD